MDARLANAARVVFLAVTLALPVAYYLVLNPIFAAPNAFEDGRGYLVSAQRLITTGSPYQPWQLAGPYGAVTASDTYRYPPLFAQVAGVFVSTGAEWLFIGTTVATCFLAPLV